MPYLDLLPSVGVLPIEVVVQPTIPTNTTAVSVNTSAVSDPIVPDSGANNTPPTKPK